jgi:4-alpha-glucanotransferase
VRPDAALPQSAGRGYLQEQRWFTMAFPRSSGILCHPTSFPSRYGIGDLGQGAHDFVDWLAASRQQLWQVLPLGPTGYGDSPYQLFSAFAGNPLLISPDRLAWSGLLPDDALCEAPDFPKEHVDFGPVIAYKRDLFERSYAHFEAYAGQDQRSRFAAFREQSADWLPDFAFFMALKGHFGGGSWRAWPREVALRDPRVLVHHREKLAHWIAYHEYLQWVFDEQWRALKSHADAAKIQVIGDVPIFVAEDSADVWGHPEQFQLDVNGNPTVIAGVPPDLFSAAGQRWGNPHYRWDLMAEDGYHWWVERVRHTLTMVDIVRIDHFRGFEAYWSVPANEPTAMNGEWVKGPGADLFRAIEAALGRLPIIAEDLGVITEEVDALRHEFGFPGMKILQFAFAMENNPKYLPHTYERNCIVYPGTHDNNTTIGWFNEAERSSSEKWNCLRYAGSNGHDLAWDFIRLAWGSVADQAVACLQDVMSLGAEARMNFPSSQSGNWRWRYTPEMLTDALAARLRELTEIYGRASGRGAESTSG